MKMKQHKDDVSGAERIMALYEELLQCSERMLQKAKGAHWDDLISEECRYVDYFDQISRAGSIADLTPEQSVQHRVMLKKIMSRSDKTRKILESRSAELETLVANDPDYDSDPKAGKGQKISTDKPGASVYLN